MTDLVDVPREGQNTSSAAKVEQAFENSGSVEAGSLSGRNAALSDYLQTSPRELNSLLRLASGPESLVMRQFRAPMIIGEDGNIVSEPTPSETADHGERKLKRVSRRERDSLPGEAALKEGSYGVTSSRTREGFTRREINTTSGENYFVSADRRGVANHVRDSTGEWRSRDGKIWTNTENGAEKKGKYDIKYGAISFAPENGELASITGASSVRDQISARQQRIEERYGVKIGQAGEDFITRDDNRNETRIRAGMPTLSELERLELDLQRNGQNNLNGLKIFYLEKSPLNSGECAAYEGTDRPGEIALTWMARGGDRECADMSQSLSHEIGHDELDKLFPPSIGESDNPAAKKLMESIGWRHVNGEYQIRDRNQNYWRMLGDDRWQRADGKGNVISDAAMRNRALVRPATPYIDSAEEVIVEGLGLLRSGEQNRGNLARESPELYRQIRDFDQTRINEKFKLDDGGSPLIIRDIDGRLIANSPAARERITRWELRRGIR